MAKKQDNVDMDDINFDDFGDFGDGGFDGESPKPGSRKPVTTLKGSFVSGVKEGLMDRGNQLNYVKSSLPKEYRSALDVADTAASNARELYDTAAKEAKPIVDNLKKLTRSSMPGLKEKLPKGLAERLEQWAGEARSSESIDPEESEIALSLGTIFNAHQEQQQKMQEEMEQRQQARDIVASKQSDSQLTALQQVVMNTTRMVSYQDQINAQYQRKSLELQYRHYFTSRKTLDVMQQHLEVTKVSMETIVKNTALPDILKEHNTEKAAELMKRRWLGTVTEPASQWFGQMGRRVMTKAKADITVFLKDFSASMEDMMTAAEGMAENIDQQAEMEGDTKENIRTRMAGQSLGGMAAQGFYAKVNDLFEFLNLPSLRTVMKDSKFGNAAGTAGAFVGNRETIYRGWIDKNKEKSGLRGILANYIDEAAGNPDAVNTMVSKNMGQDDLDSRQYWTLQNSRTLNDIIPGWLSKIHYEIKYGNTFQSEVWMPTDSKAQEKVKRAVAATEAEHFFEGTGRFEKTGKIKELVRKELEDKDIKIKRGDKLDEVVRAFYPNDEFSSSDRTLLPASVFQSLRRFFATLSYRKEYDGGKILEGLVAEGESEVMDIYAQSQGRKVSDAEREHLRDYTRNAFGYDKKTQWDIDGTPTKFPFKLTNNSGMRRWGRFVKAYREYHQAEKGHDLGRVLDIETRGLAYSEALESIGVTKRQGDEWKPERHLVGKSEIGQVQEDVVHAISSRQKRANGGLMFNAGGQVPGVGPETGDKIDAKVSQGEYVVRKESTKMPGVLPLLRYLNSLGAKPGHAPTANVGFGEAFAAGGMPGGAGGSEIANLHTMMEEKLKYSNEVLSDILTVMANIRTKPFISISAGKLSDFPDLKLNDLSGAEELLVGGKRKLMAGLGWAGGKAKGIAQWSYGIMGKAFTGAWSAATGGATSMKEWWDKKSNIYINGERKAAIEARLMEAGEYIDVKTGKVIESIKDIKGEVKNRAGEIVISAEDFVKGFHDSRLKPALGWLKDRAKDAYGLAKKPFDWVGKASSFVYDALDMPDDIYVVGSDPWKPRLYARIFREGGYFNADDGTVIKRVGQINCAIKDIRGNEVLGVHELDKLVDFEGKPIRGLAERVIDRAKGGLAQLFKLPGKAIDMMHIGAMWAGDKVMKGWAWLKDFFSGNTSISIGLFSGQATTVNRLEQIWSILNARLPGKRQKTPADFGKMSSIKLPDMSKHMEGAQNYFGKQFAVGLAKWQSAKALTAAKLEAGKMDLFEYWGNVNANRNERKRQAESFVGPMPQNKLQQVATSVGARLQELVGEKGKTEFWKRWAEKKQSELANSDVMKRLAELPKIDRRKLPADMKARYNDLVRRFQESESVLDLEELVRFREGVAGRYDAAVQFGNKTIGDLKNTAKNLKGDAKKAMDFLKNGGPKRKALLEYIETQGSQAMKDFNQGLHPMINWQKMTDEERKMLSDYNDSAEGKAYKGAKRLVDSVKSANSKLVDKVTAKTGTLDDVKSKAGAWFGDVKSSASSAFANLMGRGDDARYQEYLKRTAMFNPDRETKQFSKKYNKLGKERLALLAELNAMEGKTGLYTDAKRKNMQKRLETIDRKMEFQLTGWGGWLKKKEAAIGRGKDSLRNKLSAASSGVSNFLAGGAMPSIADATLAAERKKDEAARRKGLGLFGRLREDTSSLRGMFKSEKLANWRAAKSDKARLKELQSKGMLTLEETEERDAIQSRLDSGKKPSLWSRITRKKISHDLDGDGFREGSAEEQRQAKEKAEERGWLKRMAAGMGSEVRKGWEAGRGGGAGFLKSVASIFPKLFSGIASGLSSVVNVAKNLLTLNVGTMLRGAGKGLMSVARTAGKIIGGPGKILGQLALRGLGMAGGALFSVPGMIAVGAAALGYGLYRGAKYLFRDNQPISRFRMQQYGIDPDKEDQVSKIVELEKLLAKITSCGQGQQAKLGNGVTAEEAMQIFGVDSSNQVDVEKWVGWFMVRFKPVYLSHVTVLTNLVGKADLTEADKLMDSSTKLKYIPAVHFTTEEKSPYDMTASPFGGDEGKLYDRGDICGYFGYYNDAIAWVKSHAEETDADFAASKDPKKKAEREYEKAMEVRNRISGTWDELKKVGVRGALDNAQQYWADKLGNTEAFQATADLVNKGLTKGGVLADGAVAVAKAAADSASSTVSKWSKWRPAWRNSAQEREQLEALLKVNAAKYGIPVEHLRALAAIESGGNPKAGNASGAYGIFQFMPETGYAYGLNSKPVKGKVVGWDNRGDMALNVAAGAKLYYDSKSGVEKVAKKYGLTFEPWMMYMAHQQGVGGFDAALRAATTGEDPKDILLKGSSKGKSYSLRTSIMQNGGTATTTAAEFLDMWKGKYAGALAVAGATTSQTSTGPAVANAKPVAPSVAAAPAPKAVVTASSKAAANTGSTKAPATVDADDIGVKPTTAEVVQEAVQPKPIVPAVAANDTPRVGMEDEMPVARVEPITVAATPVATEPSSGLSKASVTVDDMDEFVVSDKQAREAAVAQAERERSEAMNNTSLGIDGAVRLLREQLKVNLSMDRSLTTISETLKRMERQHGGSGSSSGSSQSGGGAAPVASKRQTVAQSDPPPVSLSKRA